MEPLFAKHHPCLAMHLAAESHVDLSIDGLGDFIETNIAVPYNLLEFAIIFLIENIKIKYFILHHILNDEVFGFLPLGSGLKFTEETAYDPQSPYSVSKATGSYADQINFVADQLGHDAR